MIHRIKTAAFTRILLLALLSSSSLSPFLLLLLFRLVVFLSPKIKLTAGGDAFLSADFRKMHTRKLKMIPYSFDCESVLTEITVLIRKWREQIIVPPLGINLQGRA
jgi:hypothetical protein